MPSKKNKALHVSTSLQQLNKMAEQVDVKINNALQCNQYCTSATKIFSRAEAQLVDGDEEMAYFLYMRYFHILGQIKGTYFYKKTQTKFDDILRASKPGKAIMEAEKLSKSLSERYTKLLNEKDKEPLKLPDVPDVLNFDPKVDALTRKKSDQPQLPRSTSQNDKETAPSNVIKPNDADLSGLADVANVDNGKASSPGIEVTELYELLKSKDHGSILVLDIRDAEDFNASRIKNIQSINIPPGLLLPGASVNSIDRRLSKSVFNVWITRTKRDHIVIVNHDSSSDEVAANDPASILKDVIYIWDSQNILKCEPRILIGGFEHWHLLFPSLCTDPMYSRKKPKQVLDDPLSALSTLTYPSLINAKASPAVTPPIETSAPSNGTTTTANGAESMAPNPRASKVGPISQSKELLLPKPPNNKEQPDKPNNGVAPAVNKSLSPKTPSADPEASSYTTAKDVTKKDVTSNGNTSADLTKYKYNKEVPEKQTKIDFHKKPGLNSVDIKDEEKATSPRHSAQNSSGVAKGSIAPQSKDKASDGVADDSGNQKGLTTSIADGTTTSAIDKLKVIKPVLNDIDINKAEIPDGRSNQPPPSLPNEQGINRPVQNHVPPAQYNAKTDGIPSPSNIIPTNNRDLNSAMTSPLRPSVATPSEKSKNIAIAPAIPLPGAPKFIQVSQDKSGLLPTTPGLPTGWEMATNGDGKIFYKDHNSKQTFWKLPSHIIQQTPGSLAKGSQGHTAQSKPANGSELKKSRPEETGTTDKSSVAKKPPMTMHDDFSKSNLKRSLSSPNLAALNATPTIQEQRPVVDRSVKPQDQPRMAIDRSRKPISSSRLHNLMPVHGSSKGHFLTGLKNLGNTCYMNAIVQCLSVTIPFSRYLLSGKFEVDINPKNRSLKPGYASREIAFLLKVLWSGQYRSVSPSDFRYMVGMIRSEFATSQQQDAHELLIILLEELHKDLGRNLPLPAVKDDENLPDHLAAERAWSIDVHNKNRLLVDLLQGQFYSTVCCTMCNYRSVTFESFDFLQLELPSKSSCTLEDCLASFTRTEKITGKDSWNCPKCKKYREATKTIQICKLPPILIIQLKRFSSNGIWHNKLQTTVNFPLQNLHVSRTSLSRATEERATYNLYATVNHYGSFECGHYTAYCDVALAGKWFCFDDNVVRELDRSSVKSAAAYLLFYTAIDFK